MQGGDEIPLGLPAGVEVDDVEWTADGRRFALVTRQADHMGLWVGSVQGDLEKVEGLAIFADGTAWVSTDNDGVDDSSGETFFWSIGTLN